MKTFRRILASYATALLCAAAAVGTTACESDSDNETEGGGNGGSTTTVAVTGISVSPETVSLQVGDTQVLDIIIAPANATDKTYSAESNNKEVATIEGSTIKAVGEGEAVITVTSTDGGFTGTCTVSVEAAFDGILAANAGAYYPGDQWGTGSDNILLALLADDAYTYRVEDNYGASYLLTGEGTALWLDLNAPAGSGEKVPAGTYKALLEDPGEGESQDFTFLPGTDMGDWGIVGSFIYTLEAGASEATYTMVEDGTVTVETSGDSYTVLATVTAGGTSYNFKFTGSIADAKNNPAIGGGGDDDEYEEIVLNNLTMGEMDYYGEAYGPTGTDYANWTILLATDAISNEQGPLIQFEINTASSATTAVTPGTYTVFEGDIEASSFVPFSAVPAFMQEGSSGGYYYFGTWYYDANLEPTYGATSGWITIEESGSGYSIEFEFTDADFGGKVSGSYEGPLYYYDATAEDESSLAPASLSKRSSARKAATAKTLPAGRQSRRPAFRR